jgi:hypothetical protein
MKLSMVANVDKMPLYWDGHELRQYIADTAARQVFVMDKQRKKEYGNDLIIHNI